MASEPTSEVLESEIPIELDESEGVEARNNVREEQLQSYEVGVTTVQEFLSDGWNAEDPVYQVLGILAMHQTSESLEYVIGAYGGVTPGPTVARLASAEYRAAEELARMFPGAALDYGGLGGDAIQIERCRLEFKAGVLANINRLGNPPDKSSGLLNPESQLGNERISEASPVTTRVSDEDARLELLQAREDSIITDVDLHGIGTRFTIPDILPVADGCQGNITVEAMEGVDDFVRLVTLYPKDSILFSMAVRRYSLEEGRDHA